MTRREFRLPDLGEGLTEAEIVRWLVTPGDQVEINQPLVEVETAKALVEIPSPVVGRLVERYGAEGDTVAVGTVLVTVEDGAEPAGEPPGPAVPDAAGAGVPGGAPPRPGGEREPVLVGYGPRDTASANGRPRRRRHQAAATAGRTAPRHPIAASAAARAGTVPTPPAAGGGAGGAARKRVLAKPPVRKLARDLGVDLAGIAPTGPAGTISRDDVEAAARMLVTGAPVITAPPTVPQPEAPAATPTAPAGPAAGAPDRRPGEPGALAGQIPPGAAFDPASRTWRIPVSGVRRATAAAMVSSASTAPHVTEFISADLTETMALRDRLAGLPEFHGTKVSPLLLVARALLIAVRRHPMINSAWVDDGERGAQIVVSERVNLGIAVASPRGLLVPNIPDAGRLGLAELARALQELTERTRSGQARPADLTGGTITITNVGVFGVDIGTPILNPGEAAILAVGAIRPAPWVHQGELAVRTVGQLALSFDHRLVDGELGSAVLADVAAMLTDPALMLAWS